MRNKNFLYFWYDNITFLLKVSTIDVLKIIGVRNACFLSGILGRISFVDNKGS